MRAIETRYKGYRFRSRLEARWAVFFETLGLKWEYEPEGYELTSRQWSTLDNAETGSEVTYRYLPDFYIGDCGIFVEIKGSYPEPEELAKCRALAQHTGRAVLLCWGLPFENPSYLFCWDLGNSSAGSYENWVSFLWPVSSQMGCIIHDERFGERELCLKSDFANTIYDVRCEPFDPENDHFDWAVKAARAARFEHGEKP